MNIQVSDVTTVGSLVIGTLLSLKYKRKTIVICLFAVTLLSAAVSIFSRTKSQASVQQSAGAQSIQQNANVSGGSTNVQAGKVEGDLNVGGLSKDDREMLKGLVKKHALEGMAELTQTYRHGFVIFGLSPTGQPVTYQGELNDMGLLVDWSEMTVATSDSGVLRVENPRIFLRYPDGSEAKIFHNSEEYSPVTENVPMRSMASEMIFYEVLDIKNRIFLIGFK